MANNNLTNAKKAKNDEFYTQWQDIEKEINAYLEFDENVFKGKTVLLPCDDPEWSSFTKFFASRFEKFGIKKLISTSYASASKSYDVNYQPTSFESTDPEYDETKTITNGKIFTLDQDITKDGKIDINDLEWHYLEGDGNFNSEEVRELRNEADIIITNPPFSLFRDFLAWIVEVNKQFVIIGNINALTYKEIFPLIKDNKMWLGATNFNRGMYFRVPDDFVYATSYKFEKEQNGIKVNRVPSVCWFSNLDHGRRHQPLSLMTMEDNLKFNKHKDIKGKDSYSFYDNYDAIEVPTVHAIPSDYSEVMGVPITFIDKYNPDQFEIVGSDAFDGTPPTKTYPKKSKVKDGKRMKSQTGTMGCVIREDTFGAGTYFDVGYPVKAVYKRIFIKHKR